MSFIILILFASFIVLGDLVLVIVEEKAGFRSWTMLMCDIAYFAIFFIIALSLIRILGNVSSSTALIGALGTQKIIIRRRRAGKPSLIGAK